jgi:hypothetical protein
MRKIRQNSNTNRLKYNGLNGPQKSKRERINNGRLKENKEESKG